MLKLTGKHETGMSVILTKQ